MCRVFETFVTVAQEGNGRVFNELLTISPRLSALHTLNTHTRYYKWSESSCYASVTNCRPTCKYRLSLENVCKGSTRRTVNGASFEIKKKSAPPPIMCKSEISVRQGCTNPGRLNLVRWLRESSTWNLIHVTVLSPRILNYLTAFSKIYSPLM